MSATAVCDRPVAQATLGRAECIFRSALAYFYERLIQAWERIQAGRASTREEKGHPLLATVHAVRITVEAVDLIFGLAAKTGIYRRSPLEHCFWAVQTLRQHGSVSESHYQTVGRVLLGLEPHFPLTIFGPVADWE